MNFVPCLTWVAKGIAKSCPDKLQLSPEELKNLIEETKELAGSINETVEDEDSDKSSSDEESETTKDNSDEVKSIIEVKKDPDEEDGFDAKYNLDDYDNDDEERPFMKIADVAVYVDNKEDKYITEQDAIDEDEQEEQEDFLIKDTDNLLLVGHIEEESSVLEIQVYNKEEDALYVHHDIVLPSYPLALEWLDYHPSDETPGNYVAVGDMGPVIKIYDLDVVEALEPDYCLGEIKKEKKKGKKSSKTIGHSDAVISLSWNKGIRKLLASGSADSTIIVWDLEEAVVLNTIEAHTGKVQSLLWHPFETYILLSGCTDGLVKVHDCRTLEAECKSWSVNGEIERVCWNLHSSVNFFCSTDDGFVYSFDLASKEIQHKVKAHSEGVTGLDMDHLRSNILISASMDKTLKIWNIENGFSLIKSMKLKVGSIYCAKFAPDTEMTVAVGGNDSNSLKVIDLAEILEGPKAEEEKPQSLNSATNKVQGIKTESSSAPPKKKIKSAQKFMKPQQTSWQQKPQQNSNYNSRTGFKSVKSETSFTKATPGPSNTESKNTPKHKFYN